jgi:hypothetical protein
LQSQAQQQQQQSHQHHNDNDNDNERRKLLMATSTTTAPTAQMMLTSEVESMLRYEIRGYHSTTTSRSLREDNNEIKEKKEDYNDSGHDYLSVDDWIIIPMVPLDRTAMKDILLRRIAAVIDETTSGIENTAVDKNSIISNDDDHPPIPPSSSLLITESATDRLLDALEWHQWIHKTTGGVLRIWSPDGARPLFRLWKERILGTIRNRPECHHYIPTMNTSSSSSSSSVVQQQVLDFEETTTEQFVIRSCVEMMVDGNNDDSVNSDYYHDRNFMITTTNHRTWNCRLDNNINGATTMKAKNAYSTCRFYL